MSTKAVLAIARAPASALAVRSFHLASARRTRASGSLAFFVSFSLHIYKAEKQVYNLAGGLVSYTDTGQQGDDAADGN